MFDLNTIAQDLKAEKEGLWMLFPGSKLEFKLARAGGPEYDAACADARVALRERADRSGSTPTEEDFRQAAVDAVASHILLGWRLLPEEPGNEEEGAEEEVMKLDGEPFPFSRENAAKLLRDPRFKDVYRWILQRCQTAELFRIKDRERDAGKSARY